MRGSLLCCDYVSNFMFWLNLSDLIAEPSCSSKSLQRYPRKYFLLTSSSFLKILIISLNSALFSSTKMGSLPSQSHARFIEKLRQTSAITRSVKCTPSFSMLAKFDLEILILLENSFCVSFSKSFLRYLSRSIIVNDQSILSTCGIVV